MKYRIELNSFCISTDKERWRLVRTTFNRMAQLNFNHSGMLRVCVCGCVKVCKSVRVLFKICENLLRLGDGLFQNEFK